LLKVTRQYRSRGIARWKPGGGSLGVPGDAGGISGGSIGMTVPG